MLRSGLMPANALGRLIHRVTPWEVGETQPVRVESFWSDGACRIQDIVIDPYPSAIPWMGIDPVEQTAEVRLEAEYIDAAHAGARVDEIHAVIDWWDRVAFHIKDAASGTVLGYATASGEIAEQFAWDPFCRILEHDLFPVAAEAPSFQNGFQGGRYDQYKLRSGHHGLNPSATPSEYTSAITSALNA